MRIDAHCDTMLFLQEYESLNELPQAHLDYQRLRQYLDVSFFSMYIAQSLYADKEYETCIQLLHRFRADIARYPDLTLLQTREQLQNSHQKQILLGMEGAAPLGEEAIHLDEFYRLGLRTLSLTWNDDNLFAGGCAGNQGVTAAGWRLLERCARLGIVLDLAHLAPRGFWQIAAHYEEPFIVSHTCCAALNADTGPVRRNLDDTQLREVAAHGGVVGICFVPDFLGQPASLTRIAEHIEHAVACIGAEHVGIGSDFDGTVLPPGIQGLQDWPALAALLARRGMSQEELQWVLGGSFYRVLQQLLPTTKTLEE